MIRNLSTTEVAERLGCQAHHVRRIFDEGLLPCPDRIGLARSIPASMLPKIEKALRQRGFLDESPALASA